MGEAYQIEQIILQPTPFCNLRCRYCYLPDRGNKSRMPPDLPAKVVASAISSGWMASKTEICWHAGEPLAVGLPFYREAIENIEKILPKGYEISYGVQTNATLIRDEWCQFFKLKNFFIGVSLDGPKKFHDLHRIFSSGKGSFDLTMRGLSYLKEYEIPRSVIAVLTYDSLKNPDEIYDFFETLGISSVGFNIEEEEGINRSETIRKEDFLEKSLAFFKRIYERQKTGGVKVRELQFAEHAILSSHPIRSLTATPFSILSVDYQGNFSTFSPELLGMSHPLYESFTFGNIYKDSLKEALSNPLFQKVAKEIQKGVENCKKFCPYFFLCGGGAPTNKLYENGSFESTETFFCKSRIQIPIEIALAEMEESKTFANPP